MRKTHAPRTWYISEHPEYRAKIDLLRKMKSKLDKTNGKAISQEKFNLKNERRKKNEQAKQP
jgi:hypothetical protein